jgi:hypothetical protein
MIYGLIMSLLAALVSLFRILEYTILLSCLPAAPARLPDAGERRPQPARTRRFVSSPLHGDAMQAKVLTED